MNILRIRVQLDMARPPQGPERLDHRHHFHAIVSGGRLPARQRLFVGTHPEQHPPASHARVAFTSAIRPYFDNIFFFHAVIFKQFQSAGVLEAEVDCVATPAAARAPRRRILRFQAGVIKRMPATFFTAETT